MAAWTSPNKNLLNLFLGDVVLYCITEEDAGRITGRTNVKAGDIYPAIITNFGDLKDDVANLCVLHDGGQTAPLTVFSAKRGELKWEQVPSNSIDANYKMSLEPGTFTFREFVEDVKREAAEQQMQDKMDAMGDDAWSGE